MLESKDELLARLLTQADAAVRDGRNLLNGASQFSTVAEYVDAIRDGNALILKAADLRALVYLIDPPNRKK